jgi:hypothetical protein
MFYLFHFLYQYFLHIYSQYIKKHVLASPLPPPNELENYTEKRKREFSKFSTTTNDPSLHIDPLFYSKEKYRESILLNPRNPIEELWKSRVLYESTPRGNIIMYYDAYKMGFSYHCDTNGLPYSFLNLIAMRYVSVFKCLDFFVDTEVFESPLVNIHKEKESPPRISSSSPSSFAKFKIYTPTTQTETRHYNTFTSMGKITNFSFLKKPDKKKQILQRVIFQNIFESPDENNFRKIKFREWYLQR